MFSLSMRPGPLKHQSLPCFDGAPSGWRFLRWHHLHRHHLRVAVGEGGAEVEQLDELLKKFLDATKTTARPNSNDDDNGAAPRTGSGFGGEIAGDAARPPVWQRPDTMQSVQSLEAESRFIRGP